MKLLAPSRKLVLVIVGISIGFMALRFQPNGVAAPEQTSQSGPGILVVQTLTSAALDEYPVSRRFVGRVEARRESNVGFELSGAIEQVNVEEGSRVSKGQSLARLNTELLEARQRELIAARDRAQAQLELATTTRGRVREANALDAVSTQTFDEAETDYSNALASFTAAESAVNTLSVQIRRSEITAPFDGVVSQRYLDEGRVVAAGEPVIRLLESSVPEVRLAVASNSADLLAEGEGYQLTVNKKSVKGTLKSILPERQSLTRGVEAIFQLDADFGEVRSGDLAEVVVTEEVNQRGFRLPITALTESARGIWAVYVAAADGQGYILERRQVEVLHQEGDNVIVRGTLTANEQVVSAGLHRLMPGQQVRLVDNNTQLTTTGAGL